MEIFIEIPFTKQSNENGILVGVLSSKLQIQKSYLILLGATVTTIPIGVVLLFPLPPMLSYAVITASCIVFMAVATMFGVTMMTFIQRETPKHLIGKVISYAIAIITCSRGKDIPYGA